MNQAAGYMQTEPEEPENQQNGKYGPEHRPSLLSSRQLRWECLLVCCLNGKQQNQINRASRYNLEHSDLATAFLNSRRSSPTRISERHLWKKCLFWICLI